MYFTRMRKFYERESNGKFSFGGDVTEWVKVPFNQARYGRSENNTTCTWCVTRWPTGSR